MENKESEKKAVYYGEVIWFCNRRGYGFVGYEIDGVKQKDIFLHYSDICVNGFKTVYKDQKVSFSIGVNKRGDPKAIEVKIISN